jgi:hypothetical protein
VGGGAAHRVVTRRELELAFVDRAGVHAEREQQKKSHDRADPARVRRRILLRP